MLALTIRIFALLLLLSMFELACMKRNFQMLKTLRGRGILNIL